MHRRLKIGFVIDTNRINSRRTLPYVNQLEKWCSGGVIYLYTTDIVQREAEKSNDALRISKARSRPEIGIVQHSSSDQRFWDEIAAIVFPKCVLDENQRNDVQILFTARQFGMILVTNDGDSKNQPGGILGHARELHESVHVRVMRDYEAVQLVEEKIAIRESLERRFAELAGRPWADWVGRD